LTIEETVTRELSAAMRVSPAGEFVNDAGPTHIASDCPYADYECGKCPGCCGAEEWCCDLVHRGWAALWKTEEIKL
jgi:hypothetical protein